MTSISDISEVSSPADTSEIPADEPEDGPGAGPTDGPADEPAGASDVGKLFPIETASAAETVALGRELGKHLDKGALVALFGDLGTGKTHLVKGVCEAFDIPADKVSSPTFAIVHEYDGRLPVYHVDAYRVSDPSELFELGYEEYFFGDGICLIEWPARVESLLPAETLCLELTHLEEERRRIAIPTE